MRPLLTLVLSHVTRALRLAVGCVASLCRQVALRRSGVPQPVVRWRIADATILFRLRLGFLQPALVGPRRSIPAPGSLTVTSSRTLSLTPPLSSLPPPPPASL